jgi:hypothetical protein
MVMEKDVKMRCVEEFGNAHFGKITTYAISAYHH